MKNYLKNHFGLTDKGAEGALVAIRYSSLKNLSYMLPMFLLTVCNARLVKLRRL